MSEGRGDTLWIDDLIGAINGAIDLLAIVNGDKGTIKTDQVRIQTRAAYTLLKLAKPQIEELEKRSP